MNTDAYKKWRKANKDKVAGYMRKWRKKHPVKARDNMRKWIENNRQKTRDSAKAFYDANRNEINKKRREKRQANLDAFRERDRKRIRIRDKEQTSKYRSEHYYKNKEKTLAQIKAYSKAHPEVRRTTNSRRRARLLNGGRHTTEQWLAKLVLGMTCVYCGKELDFSILTKDHIIPLSKGGTDDIENVVPSCLRCNQTKSCKLLPVKQANC